MGRSSGGATSGALRHQLRPERDRWYLDASWKTTPEPGLSWTNCGGPVLGVDLNADHLACCVLDAAGNPSVNPSASTWHRWAAGVPARRAGARGPLRSARPRPATPAALRSWWRTSTSLTRAPSAAKPWAAGQRGKATAPHHRRYSHRQVPHQADQHGRPARYRGDRGGRRLHQ